VLWYCNLCNKIILWIGSFEPIPHPPWGDSRRCLFCLFCLFPFTRIYLIDRVVYLILFFNSIFHISFAKVIIILTPRFPEWPARGKRFVVGLIRKPLLCSCVIFSSFVYQHLKINPSLIPRLRSTWIERGSWRLFFLSKNTPLKLIKIYKTPVCMLCTWLRFVRSVKLYQKHLGD